MGLFDDLSGALKGAAGQFEAAAMPALISAVLAKTNLGDMQGLVAKLQQGGLGNQVQSWLGDGKNLPITADQLKSALGNDQVKEIAQHFGLPVDSMLTMLAEHLPAAVDQASSGGAITPPA
jgi:uncharacterized protein YidB (DUF937 family)